MNCPRCQSSEINSSGICLICGCEAPRLNKEPARNTRAIRLEEETGQNSRNIIDAVVSRQTVFLEDLPPMPAAELSFWGINEKEELFIAADDGAPDAASDRDDDDAYASDTADVVPDVPDAPPDAAVDVVDSPYPVNSPDSEGRLIFFSRTLSGLIDLLLIALFSGIFLGMADHFTNALMLSSINEINFPALFLLIYFMYSIFFLGTNGQTIGMMATDLRVVGINKNGISISQAFRRSAAFLISLFGLGIGLLAGLFTRKCLCLHDRLSGTRVVRILKQYDSKDAWNVLKL